MKYIGIDPGLDGAVAVIDSHMARFFDTPTVTTKAKGSKKSHRMMDAAECVNILMREVGRNADAMVVLEKVSAAPIEGRTQGTTSMFNFGVGFGNVDWYSGLAPQIPYTLVHPRTWKSQLDAGPGHGERRVYPPGEATLPASGVMPESQEAPRKSRRAPAGALWEDESLDFADSRTGLG